MNKFRTTANSGRRGGELDIVIDRKTRIREFQITNQEDDVEKFISVHERK